MGKRNWDGPTGVEVHIVPHYLARIPKENTTHEEKEVGRGIGKEGAKDKSQSAFLVVMAGIFRLFSQKPAVDDMGWGDHVFLVYQVMSLGCFCGLELYRFS